MKAKRTSELKRARTERAKPRSVQRVVRGHGQKCKHFWIYSRTYFSKHDDKRACALAGCLKRQWWDGYRWSDLDQKRVTSND